MKFRQAQIAGAYLIEPEPHSDDRGFFARTWCRREFQDRGLAIEWVQCNVSFSQRRGTLRGLHYQEPPHEEAKLVRCTRGAIYDVIADLRSASATFAQWEAFELAADNYRQLYIPAGVAHGFATLTDESEVFYQMSQFYCPQAARGVRWDDPVLAIQWPITDPYMSPKDRSYAFLAARSVSTT